MPLHTDIMQRIMVEVQLGVPRERSQVDWTPEAEQFADRFAKWARAKDIEQPGWSLDFTPEMVEVPQLE